MLPHVKIGRCPLLLRVASSTVSPTPGVLFFWGDRKSRGHGKQSRELGRELLGSVHSGHHCPRDPFKIGELGCPPLSMQHGGLVVFGSGSRGTDSSRAIPAEIHAGCTHCTSGVPPQWNKMPKPGPWQGFAAGAWRPLSPPMAKETTAWNVAMLLGRACGGKPIFSFLSLQK